MACQDWFKDISRNPQTHRPIVPFGPTFTRFEQMCTLNISGDELYGLVNTGSSCYADSILVALFARPNDIINRYMLQQKLVPISQSKRYFYKCHTDSEKDLKYRKRVQHSLQEIVMSMRYKRNIKSCIDLRSSLGKCRPPQNFHREGQQDAKEYLQYLFELFGMNVAKTESTTLFTNDLNEIHRYIRGRTSRDHLASLVWDIDPETLSKTKKGTSLQDLLSSTTDSVLSSGSEYRRAFGKNVATYRRVISRKKLIDSPYLVFHIIRLDPITETVNFKKLTPPETITLPSGRTLSLSAIVLFKSRHYMCNFKDGLDEWYHYDDLRDGVKRLGSYDDMIQKKDPRAQGTLFFYT